MKDIRIICTLLEIKIKYPDFQAMTFVILFLYVIRVNEFKTMVLK